MYLRSLGSGPWHRNGLSEYKDTFEFGYDAPLRTGRVAVKLGGGLDGSELDHESDVHGEGCRWEYDGG